MDISISAAMLLGIVVIVLVKGGYIRLGSAVACALFGFTLASTGMAPTINSGLASFAKVVSGF
ncbi:hypothetical protein I5Q34_26445 [Streptomyces sp. AV19]|uniref:hypothetical protein n=1 Tax=Streptomyces sp. AV19 TaxID=2793068 RepID=UPI0018FF10D6|nr:hypothetical protein [Streptomyces sp. AV19]MBH1937770.1 hypothetical protein [Streptomyces sp. AV19]MDG4533658.1 hypothetical protein [Streptomyces sp. AV19]